MTTFSSRTRAASNSTRRKQQQQKVPEPVIVSEEEEEEEEEESAEDESVTRCVCGKQHSIGLMVCCDDCEVWQHCECMGLEEEDIPDQYFCEQCRPEDHIQIKGYDNKTRRYYKPSRTVKKRNTNSRDNNNTSTSVDDGRTNGGGSISSNSSSSSSSSSSSCSNNKGAMESSNTEITISDSPTDETIEGKSSRPKRKSTKSEKKSRPSGSTNGRKWNSHSFRRSNKAPRSRTSTPQPEAQTTPTSTSSILFEHLSPSARETSPPAKIRIPSARMTISEMNKRANQILEYICSLQVEMATSKKRNEKKLLQEHEEEEDEEDEICKRRKLIDAQISETMTKAMVQLEQEEKFNAVAVTSIRENNRKPTPILIPPKTDHTSSPSSSLSSASTIPLEEEEEEDRFIDTEKSVAEEALEKINKPKEQTSTEIMDTLTRQVIIFQRRFGQFSFGNAMTDDPESIEYEGPPITRSREFYQGRNTW